MGEVAYYLKHAQHEVERALYALDGTDFNEAKALSRALAQKIENIRRLSNDVMVDLDMVRVSIVNKAESQEE
jgi:hypothetical protein